MIFVCIVEQSVEQSGMSWFMCNVNSFRQRECHVRYCHKVFQCVGLSVNCSC